MNNNNNNNVDGWVGKGVSGWVVEGVLCEVDCCERSKIRRDSVREFRNVLTAKTCWKRIRCVCVCVCMCVCVCVCV